MQRNNLIIRNILISSGFGIKETKLAIRIIKWNQFQGSLKYALGFFHIPKVTIAAPNSIIKTELQIISNKYVIIFLV